VEKAERGTREREETERGRDWDLAPPGFRPLGRTITRGRHLSSKLVVILGNRITAARKVLDSSLIIHRSSVMESRSKRALTAVCNVETKCSHRYSSAVDREDWGVIAVSRRTTREITRSPTTLTFHALHRFDGDHP